MASAVFPETEGFWRNVKHFPAFIAGQFKFQTASFEVLAQGRRGQRGNAVGFVAIRVFRAYLGEGIVAEVVDDPLMVVPSWVGMVTLPAAQSNGANVQQMSGLRLVELQLETTATEVSTNGFGLFGDGDAAIMGGQIGGSGTGNGAFIRWQHRAHRTGKCQANHTARLARYRSILAASPAHCSIELIFMWKFPR